MIYVFCLIICFPFKYWQPILCMLLVMLLQLGRGGGVGNPASAGLSILTLLQHLLHLWSSPEAVDDLATQIHKSNLLC